LLKANYSKYTSALRLVKLLDEVRNVQFIAEA